jgi:hypothetical protein
MIADEPGDEEPGRDVQVEAPAEVGQAPPVHAAGLKAVWAKQMLLKMKHNVSTEKNSLQNWFDERTLLRVDKRPLSNNSIFMVIKIRYAKVDTMCYLIKLYVLLLYYLIVIMKYYIIIHS